MNFFRYFFRAVEDQAPIEAFGPVHLLLMLLAFGGAFLIIFRRQQLFSSGWAAKGARICAWLLLAFQVVKYLWDILSGHFSLANSLPLYPCRIAVWLLILSTLFGRRRCWPLGFVWGLLGAVVATILVDPYPFAWPHFTNLDFFVTHIAMGWLVLFRIIADHPDFSRDTLRRLITTTNLFLITAVLTNFVLKILGYTDVNYAYLNQAPDFMLAFLPSGLVFSVLLAITYNLVVYLVFITAKIICERYYAQEIIRATH